MSTGGAIPSGGGAPVAPLADDHDLPGGMAYVMARLDQSAPRYAALLGGALDDAQQGTAGLYQPGGGGEDQ